MDGLLHDVPNLSQIVPDLRALIVLYILPVGRIFLMQAVHDIYDTAIRIDGGRALLVEVFIGERPTTDTEDCIGVKELACIIKAFELHPIRMEGEDDIRFPQNLRGGYRRQCLEDSSISHVPLACSRQAPIERDVIALGLRTTVSELLGGTSRPHGVATAGATPDTEYLLDCLH